MMENCSGKVLFIVQSDGELLRNLTSIVTRQEKTQTWVHMLIRASAEQFGAVGSSRNASKTKSRYAGFLKTFFSSFLFSKVPWVPGSEMSLGMQTHKKLLYRLVIVIMIN